jgi:hypothetical protein
VLDRGAPVSGIVGYSATADPPRFDGLQLHTDAWSVAPVTVVRGRHASTMAVRAARGSEDDRLGLVPADALLRLKRGAG